MAKLGVYDVIGAYESSVNISGAAALVVSSTGSLSLGAALTGSANHEVRAIGIVTTSSPQNLGGTAQLALAATGEVTSVPAVNISGAANLAVSATGVIESMPSLTDYANQVSIHAHFNQSFIEPEVSGNWFENRAHKLTVTIDNDIDATGFDSFTFGLFELDSDSPNFTKSLNSGISIDDGKVVISLDDEDMSIQNYAYIELRATDGPNKVHIFSTSITIQDTRLN